MNFKSKKFDELTTTELYEILKSRAEIFIVEHKMNCLDLDGIDYNSFHCFYEDNGRVIAYLRAFLNGNVVKIGRVLTIKHNMGIGRKLMEKSIPAIKKHFNCEKISLNSQKHAVGFYKKFGFKTTSDEFLEEGIIHVSMSLGE